MLCYNLFLRVAYLYRTAVSDTHSIIMLVPETKRLNKVLTSNRCSYNKDQLSNENK